MSDLKDYRDVALDAIFKREYNMIQELLNSTWYKHFLIKEEFQRDLEELITEDNNNDTTED